MATPSVGRVQVSPSVADPGGDTSGSPLGTSGVTASGTGVGVGGIGVSVAVGGTDVAVGSAGVAVGGAEVVVGGAGVVMGASPLQPAARGRRAATIVIRHRRQVAARDDNL